LRRAGAKFAFATVHVEAAYEGINSLKQAPEVAGRRSAQPCGTAL
jgi:hypothetical protein